MDLVFRDQNVPASDHQGLLWCRHTVGSRQTVSVALVAAEASGQLVRGCYRRGGFMSGRHRRGGCCRNPAAVCHIAAQCVPLLTGCHKRDGSRGWDDCRSCHATACRPGYAGALTLVAGMASRTG
eukprot:scaffold21424_cov68-Phaeocystis_antarctica.AAC.2